MDVDPSFTIAEQRDGRVVALAAWVLCAITAAAVLAWAL